MSLQELGHWAIVDIETTGLDPQQEDIIDIGLLQFKGGELVHKYESLVHLEDAHFSYYIQKLTGISAKELTYAPSWSEVEDELFKEEKPEFILAHNSDFEDKFLNQKKSLKLNFLDSIPFLALVFPQYQRLNLEFFLQDLALAEEETHRGLQDSIDLLKVILLSATILNHHPSELVKFKGLVHDYCLQDYWPLKFIYLNLEELRHLATQIDFNLDEAYQKFQEKEKQVNSVQMFQSPENPNKFFKFDGSSLKKIFTNESDIQKKLPRYKYRKEQEMMGVRVGQAFKHNVHALIQAPTGTGKTLGYMIPSALYSLESKRPVLLATGTKALQHQAVYKDVEQLRTILGCSKDEYKVTKIIGSSNHYCELIYRNDIENKRPNPLDPLEERISLAYIERILQFNQNSPYDNQLNVETLPYVMKKKLKYLQEYVEQIRVDFRSCLGHRCPFKGSCSYISGIKKASDSHLIIGNHSLMLQWPSSLARPSHVIVDEAHRLEREATSTFTRTLTGVLLDHLRKQLENLNGIGALFYLLSQDDSPMDTQEINTLRKDLYQYAGELKEHLDYLEISLLPLFQKMTKYTSLYWNELPYEQLAYGRDSLCENVLIRINQIKLIFDKLWQQFSPFVGRWDKEKLNTEQSLMALSRFETFMDQIQDYKQILIEWCLEKAQKEELVRVLRYHEEDGFEISVIPLDIGRYIQLNLIEASESVVFTSATLGTGEVQNSTFGIEWALGHHYIDQKKRFKNPLFIPPLFDYAQRSKVFLCEDVPLLYDNAYVSKIFEYLIPLINDLGGKSLLLFSAKYRFEQAREILLASFEGKIPVYIQGMGTNIVEDFQKNKDGILLGMESFGEGIDIPGNDLQFIFIDKIPDLPVDSITKKRREYFERHFGGEFLNYYLAYRSRVLLQKMGRLLRTQNDFGAIIIADQRIKRWKKNTKDNFMQLLHPYQIEQLGIKESCKLAKQFILEGPYS